MQWLSSGTMPLVLASSVAARAAPYRRPRVCRCCHPAAQSSGTAVQPAPAVVATARIRTLKSGGRSKSLEAVGVIDRMGCQRDTTAY